MGKEPTNFKRVNVAPYLPHTVRDVITWRKGTVWYVMLVESKQKSAAIVAKERMKTVVDFTVDQEATMNKLQTVFEMVAW